MLTGNEIANGYFRDWKDGGDGYYRGMYMSNLLTAGVPESMIVEFITHPDVITWDTIFLMGQVMMFIGGIRDARLHDITCMLVRK